MAESQKTDIDILVKEFCPIGSSPLLFVNTKSGDLVSATLCYGCTVVHARQGGTTLYHLSDKTACSGYMSGIAKRSSEGGYDTSWGYCDSLSGDSIKGTLDRGYITVLSRRPRVFDQYHLGGVAERYSFPGAVAPKDHAPMGDNLMSLLGIEDADPSAPSPPAHAQTPKSGESVSESKESPLAPHRRASHQSSDIRKYIESLRA